MGLLDVIKPLPVAGIPEPTTTEPTSSRLPIVQPPPLMKASKPFVPVPMPQTDDLQAQLAQRTLTAASTLEPTKFPGSKSLDMLQTLAKYMGKGQGQLPGYPTYPGGPKVPYSGPTSFTPLPAGRYPVIDETPNPGYDPSQVTPEIQRTSLELWARFPGLTNMGTHNVRNVAGTNTPSQHSYGNAIDIGGPAKSLAEAASWAVAHAAKLGVSQVIYQTSIWTKESGWHPYGGVPHSTHVHISGPLTYGNTNPSYPAVKFTPPKTKPQPSRPQRVTRRETSARRRRQV